MATLNEINKFTQWSETTDKSGISATVPSNDLDKKIKEIEKFINTAGVEYKDLAKNELYQLYAQKAEQKNSGQTKTRK